MQILPATPDQRTELTKRAGAEVLLGISAVFLIQALLRDPPPAPPTHTALASIGGQEGAYVLPVRYDGLIVAEDVDDGNVMLFTSERASKPSYEFSLRLRLVIAGENMFDVEGSYIPSDLKRDFFAVQSRFCERNKTAFDFSGSKMTEYCSVTPPPSFVQFPAPSKGAP